MNNLNEYLKYYFLEEYLFKEVSINFKRNGYLSAEEFFAIVIWKRNASKTRIKDSLIKNAVVIRNITTKIHAEDNPVKKLEILTSIEQIGVSFASAILTVCYPNDFTIADYRADNAIEKLGRKKENWRNIIEGINENISIENIGHRKYFRYLEICKSISEEENMLLRDFDRYLWAYDFYEGKNGLRELASKYDNRTMTKENG